MKNFYKNKKGFTLIEALVAVAILLIGVTTVFSVARSGISSTSAVRNRVTAMFLAQEAMEAVKNKINSNIQKISWHSESIGWLDGVIGTNGSILECGFGDACGYMIRTATGGTALSDNFFNCFGLSYGYGCDIVSYQNIYEQGASTKHGTDTGFVREIQIEPVAGHEDDQIMVTVTVSRPSQPSFPPFVLKNIMYNWF